MKEKNIFLLWLQGWENAFWLNKQVAESWEINNPDWRVTLINFKNLKNYVDDIDYIYDNFRQQLLDIWNINSKKIIDRYIN
jgi:uncharacterized protein YlzI (FlbEa/FlbD family)